MSRLLFVTVFVFFFLLASCTFTDYRMVDAPENQAYDLEIITYSGLVFNYPLGLDHRRRREGCYYFDKCRGAIETLTADVMFNSGKCPGGYSIVPTPNFFIKKEQVSILVKCNEIN